MKNSILPASDRGDLLGNAIYGKLAWEHNKKLITRVYSIASIYVWGMDANATAALAFMGVVLEETPEPPPATLVWWIAEAVRLRDSSILFTPFRSPAKPKEEVMWDKPLTESFKLYFHPEQKELLDRIVSAIDRVLNARENGSPNMYELEIIVGSYIDDNQLSQPYSENLGAWTLSRDVFKKLVGENPALDPDEAVRKKVRSMGILVEPPNPRRK